MNNIEKAELVAERIHRAATYDIFPYIFHPKMVAQIAEDLEYDESVIIACLLHDTTEDGGLSYNKIKTFFGEEVAEIVYAVTDELGRNRKERHQKTYAKIKSNWKASVVKICDRIANTYHSKQYYRSKFEMYKKEYKNFKLMIYNEEFKAETERAWKMLEKIMMS